MYHNVMGRDKIPLNFEIHFLLNTNIFFFKFYPLHSNQILYLLIYKFINTKNERIYFEKVEFCPSFLEIERLSKLDLPKS